MGLLQLLPLPGAPLGASENPAKLLQAAGHQAVAEAKQLEEAGFQGLLLENSGDVPFFKNQVPPETLASFSVIAAAVSECVKIPVGVNLLRNDSRSSLALASVLGCEFIRVQILSGVSATDQGLIENEAALLLRDRARLRSKVQIFADVHVHHGTSLSSHDLGLAIEEATYRSLADAVVISGASSERLPEEEWLQKASEFARFYGVPLYLGSGATAKNLADLLPWVEGILVGATLRKNGVQGAPLDPKRVKEFARAFFKLRSKSQSR